MRVTRSIWIAGIIAIVSAGPAGAQFYYPSFQVPHVTEREFNFALGDASHITTLVFQWREQVGVASQLSFDAGVADSDRRGRDASLLVGGQYATELMRSTADSPLDILFTAGAFVSLGGGDNAASFPIGTSIGHRFDLDGGMAVTPYIHPRLSIDVLEDETELNINFDLAGSFEFTPRIGVRLSATLGDTEAIGFGLFWRPMGLRR